MPTSCPASATRATASTAPSRGVPASSPARSSRLASVLLARCSTRPSRLAPFAAAPSSRGCPLRQRPPSPRGHPPRWRPLSVKVPLPRGCPRCRRCEKGGYGSRDQKSVVKKGLMAEMGLPQAPFSQRAGEFSQLATIWNCHNPQLHNTKTPRIATTPNPATRGEGQSDGAPLIATTPKSATRGEERSAGARPRIATTPESTTCREEQHAEKNNMPRRTTYREERHTEKNDIPRRTFARRPARLWRNGGERTPT